MFASNKFHFFLFLLLAGCSFSGSAQSIYGKIINDKGVLLPYSSVTIKGTTSGVTANNNAEYHFNLHKGKFVLVCQHIGYESVEKIVECNGDTQINFVLHEQQLMMKELVISSNAENPAYAIIRQAIKKRNYFNKQVPKYSCDYYSKDVIKLRKVPKKMLAQRKDYELQTPLLLDSVGKGFLYLSESKSTLYSIQPDKIKLLVNSSRVSGSNSFGFAFSNLINFYQNNVSVFQGGSDNRGFISPISDAALHFYKFKMLGSFEENGKVINSIRVIPKRSFEPLFSGIINIVDQDWNIHSLDVMLTKESQLELLDTLKIAQQYIQVNTDTWRLSNQVYYFGLNFFNIDLVGNFLSVYSDYQLHPNFDNSMFDNVVIKYDTAATRKSRVYWDSVRPVPLNQDEIKDYHERDSIFKINLIKDQINNNVDSLRKKQGSLKWYSFLFPGFDRVHYGNKYRYNWGVDPLLLNLQYNLAEGPVIKFSGYFEKYFENVKHRLTIAPNIRYGFGNSHVNAFVDVNIFGNDSRGPDHFGNHHWSFSAGKRVSQYNNESRINPLLNEISTWFNGKNILKSYENYFIEFGFQKKYENGIAFSIVALYEDRSPIFNVEKFTFNKQDTQYITENYPVEKVGIDAIFRHQAQLFKASISIKPGQQYIQFPNTKVSVGSKYPTFSLNYVKGVPHILGSDVDFDKWNFDIYDDKNLKLAGVLKYRFTIGGFINKNKVFIQDYRHFNSTSLKSTLNYVNGFQLMSVYGNSNLSSFCTEAHIEHHFNGLFTNKIPLMKQKKWNLLIGANAYYINGRDNYEEVFTGIENIKKLFRIDYLNVFQNGKYLQSAFVFGLGGVLSNNQDNNTDKKSSSKSARKAFSIAF